MLRIKLFIFSLACAGLFLTSCEDDITGGGTGGGALDAPFVSLVDDLDVLSFDATVTPGESFRVRLDALSNGTQLKAVEVLRDGFSLTTDEFDNENIDDTEEQNPQLLFGTDKDGLTWTYAFVAPTDLGSYLYTFDVSNDSDEVSSVSITISVDTPLEQVLTVSSGSDVISSGTVFNTPDNTALTLNVNAVRGPSEIASISVWENGSTIMDLSRIQFNGENFESNAMPLFSPDTEGFDAAVTLITTTGTNSYVIRITDLDDNSSDFAFDVVGPADTTPLAGEITVVLVSNADGPDNGSLDMSIGAAVSSGSLMADLEDLGIDNGPLATNWMQQIQPVNGAILSIVRLDMLPEGFSYASVNSKEEIEAAFNTGDQVSISPVLQAGDLLTVAADGTFYLMQVDNVIVTTNNNEDQYEFSIKF